MQWIGRLTIMAILFWSWGHATEVRAAGNVFERVSLKGLESIQVVVEDLAADITQDGLKREQIKTSVEQQLQRAAIVVEPQAENALYVYLGTVKNADGSYSFSLSLQLLQLVLLFRDPGLVTWGTTWSMDQVGSVPPTDVGELHTRIARCVNAFIRDYQRANPIQ